VITLETAKKHEAKIKSLANQLNSAIWEAHQQQVFTEVEVFQVTTMSHGCYYIAKVKPFMNPQEIGEEDED
jgi:hypothetical protein